MRNKRTIKLLLIFRMAEYSQIIIYPPWLRCTSGKRMGELRRPNSSDVSATIIVGYICLNVQCSTAGIYADIYGSRNWRESGYSPG